MCNKTNRGVIPAILAVSVLVFALASSPQVAKASMANEAASNSFVAHVVDAAGYEDASNADAQKPSLAFDHNRYKDALDAAVLSGRPLVIKGGATWCGPCQLLKRTFSDQLVQSLLKDKAIFVEVEADRKHESAEARRQAAQILRDLNVTQYPTTIVVKVSKTDDGRYVFTELGKKVGMMNVRELASFLENAFKRAK